MPLIRIDALKDARRIPIHDGATFEDISSEHFDLDRDPTQKQPVEDPTAAARLEKTLADILAVLAV